MKTLRFAFVLLLCLGVFLCLGAAACAEPAVIDSGTCGADGDNLTWTLYDTGELVIDGTGAMADYEYYVYELFDEWCTVPWYGYEISSVIIYDGVTSIGDYVFRNCRSLTSVTIPDSVTSIGESAFTGCSSLTSVTIPDSVTSIGAEAFSFCHGLKSVTIPDSVTSIGNGAFQECEGLKSVTILGSVTSIGNGAFQNCSGLTSVTIPGSVTSIGDGAFDGCRNLTSIHITSLEAWCGTNFGSKFPASYDLYLNDALVTELIIPDSVTSIGEYAFSGCNSLTNVTIPDSVTSIGENAFFYCSSLTSMTILEGVTSIGRSAFSYCSSLRSVTIPVSVTSIGEWAFNRCTAMTDVYYGGSEAQWKTISIGNDNYLLTKATIHYAVISEKYSISYDPNGGKNAPASQQKTQNIPLTLSDVRPTREKASAGTYTVRLNSNDGGLIMNVLRATRTTTYSFKGWNTAADGSGTSYAPGASYTADADVTLYAQWKSSTKTGSVTLPELARDDGIFKGWAESRDAKSGVMGKYTPKGNVTLYAIWLKADLVLPASLNTVESEAFTGGAFTYVLIPETVTRIESAAFASCPKLAYAQFAGVDTEIDAAAFDGVSGLTIIAPSGSTAESFAAAHGFDFMPAA